MKPRYYAQQEAQSALLVAKGNVASFLHKLRPWLLGTAIALFFSSCAVPSHRPGYDRSIGGYDRTPITRIAESARPSDESPRAQASTREKNQLEAIIKPWLGTPYLYGGSTRRGIDCSGLVRQVFLQWKNISLPHSTRAAWKMGWAVRKDQLALGDVVYFGNIATVTHSGIYMGNGSFAHASSSRGVRYDRLDDPYWSPRYKGARRYH
jgi:cell wall-associated NlpC family hydrolase